MRRLLIFTWSVIILSSCHYNWLEQNCFPRRFNKSVETVKLQNPVHDTIGVFETANFIFYINAAQYIREIKKELEYCKDDSANLSETPMLYDTAIIRDESYWLALSNNMADNKENIFVYETLLRTIQYQLKHNDTINFNHLPPVDKQDFNHEKFEVADYHLENNLTSEIESGRAKLYNKKTKQFENSIIVKTKYNLLVDYDKVYTANGRFVYDLNKL